MYKKQRQEKNELLKRLQGTDTTKQNVGTITWDMEPKQDQEQLRNSRLYGLLREKVRIILFTYLINKKCTKN